MKHIKIHLLLILAILLNACTSNNPSGKYDATWQSLESYEIPGWFQDAKFGIYAH